MKQDNKKDDIADRAQPIITAPDEAKKMQEKSDENAIQEQSQAHLLLKKAQDELLEARDKYLRLYAEFENFRRRTAGEKSELIHTANERLITALLPVLDDFERAEKALSKENPGESVEGFRLIHQKMLKAMLDFGLKEMETEMGAEFNPDIHEAITKVDATEEALRGRIADVLEKGYLLHEKVIRYAKVVVGK